MKEELPGEATVAESWREIWHRKGSGPPTLAGSPEEILRTLLQLDGYDSKTCNLSLADWRIQVDYVCAALELRATDTVYEVGCGAGALLYSLRPRCHGVGGLDYSGPLLGFARTLLASEDLRVLEAKDLPLEPKYDLVLSLGVFLYFPDAEYAASVVRRMVLKANRAVGILDVNDAAKKELALELRRVAHGGGHMGPEQLFLDRTLFYSLAREYGLTCRIDDGSMPPSLSSRYRYNVFLFKNPL